MDGAINPASYLHAQIPLPCGNESGRISGAPPALGIHEGIQPTITPASQR
jgi:hypothetical protein